MTGTGQNLSNPVILNSFQDPSGGLSRPRRSKVSLAVCVHCAASGQAEEWILKQVQDDDKVKMGIAA